MSFDKPFKTYKELIDLLEEKDLTVSNKTYAENILSEIPYHILTHNYKSELSSSEDCNKFNKNLSFDELYLNYITKNNFNNILLKQILRIEKSFKTKLAYLISKKYGISAGAINQSVNERGDVVYRVDCVNSDYLHACHYNDGSYNVLNKLKQNITSSKAGSGIFYYWQNKNHIPPWILSSDIPFGNSIMWYSILNPCDKDELCSSFYNYPSNPVSINVKKEFLKPSLDLLRVYRNNYAHGNKFFVDNITSVLPKNELFLLLPEGVLTKSEYLSGLGKNDTFALLLVLILLSNDLFNVSDFLIDINAVLNRYVDLIPEDTVCKLLNLPTDFRDRLMKIIAANFNVPN
ncbi:MAG: Abi family protein [Lachnospiraceae bacterium]|nr:Abi family protein [Lachnospiraceae bacterium]